MKWMQLASTTLVITAFLTGPVMADEATIPKQTVNEALRARLPEALRKAGSIVSVNNGSFPPYEIVLGTNEISGPAPIFPWRLASFSALRSSMRQ